VASPLLALAEVCALVSFNCFDTINNPLPTSPSLVLTVLVDDVLMFKVFRVE